MKHLHTFEGFLNEAKKFEFSFDYNTDEDDVKYIQNILDKAGCKAVARAGLDMEEMFVDATNAQDLAKAKKAIQKDGFEINEAFEDNLNEAKKPKSWDTMFAMNAIADYEAGKFDPEDDASLAKWEKDYNGGTAPRPGFETYDIIAYAELTGKKPDGSPIKKQS